MTCELWPGSIHSSRSSTERTHSYWCRVFILGVIAPQEKSQCSVSKVQAKAVNIGSMRLLFVPFFEDIILEKIQIKNLIEYSVCEFLIMVGLEFILWNPIPNKMFIKSQESEVTMKWVGKFYPTSSFLNEGGLFYWKFITNDLWNRRDFCDNLAEGTIHQTQNLIPMFASNPQKCIQRHLVLILSVTQILIIGSRSVPWQLLKATFMI